jgi:predicted nuclease with RNAse H fold
MWTTTQERGGLTYSSLTAQLWGEWWKECDTAVIKRQLSVLPRNWMVVPV